MKVRDLFAFAFGMLLLAIYFFTRPFMYGHPFLLFLVNFSSFYIGVPLLIHSSVKLSDSPYSAFLSAMIIFSSIGVWYYSQLPSISPLYIKGLAPFNLSMIWLGELVAAVIPTLLAVKRLL